jgi:hypothetical protein
MHDVERPELLLSSCRRALAERMYSTPSVFIP